MVSPHRRGARGQGPRTALRSSGTATTSRSRPGPSSMRRTTTPSSRRRLTTPRSRDTRRTVTSSTGSGSRRRRGADALTQVHRRRGHHLSGPRTDISPLSTRPLPWKPYAAATGGSSMSARRTRVRRVALGRASRSARAGAGRLPRTPARLARPETTRTKPRVANPRGAARRGAGEPGPGHDARRRRSWAVPVDQPVRVTAQDGRLRSVAVSSPLGELGGRLAADGSAWTAEDRLEPGTTYDVVTVAERADGKTKQTRSSFTPST